MGKTGLTPRRAALKLLEGVLDGGRLLAESSDPKGALEGLVPAERARAMRLAATVLRNLGRADVILRPYLRKAPPARVLNVLRLATVELCAESAAAHGVVDSAVALTRADGGSARLAGLVNAVLRKVATQAPALWAELPAQRLPDWLRRPLRAAYGKRAVAAMEAAHAAGAPLDLTPKEVSAAKALADELGGELLPTGSVRLATAGRVTALAGFAEGAWWVQDAAAALAVRALGPVRGMRVLDLCAAPGGKTLQLAAAGAEVTALDISAPRLQRLRQNLTRTGLRARVVVADATAFADSAPYDAVLLDAPCSASGTIRRHPDLAFARTGEIGDLLTLQARLLDHALSLLAPGGTLVFCTCSLLPAEGEAQMAAALVRNPAAAQVPVDAAALGGGADWVAPGGALRLRPDFWAERGGMDGFYIAKLRRR